MEAGAELVARARLICGEQHVFSHPTVLSAYRSDGLRRSGPLPLAAILPGSAHELAGVVSACAATSVAYRVRGAGTSHSGEALPIEDGVLIVTTRMRRILSHDSDTHEISVEAGAPISALPRIPTLSWFGVTEDPPLGTVGGYLAETGDITTLTALDVVQPDGKLVHLDERQAGYDLTGAFPGSRGRAGIAVAITLRALSPR